MKHDKFHGGPAETIWNKLVTEKAAVGAPRSCPYLLGLNPALPGTFTIFYLPGSKQVPGRGILGRGAARTGAGKRKDRGCKRGEGSKRLGWVRGWRVGLGDAGQEEGPGRASGWGDAASRIHISFGS